MLVAAAVCPPTPLLVPEAMGAAGRPETGVPRGADANGLARSVLDGSASRGSGATTAGSALGTIASAASPDAEVDAQIRQLRAACCAAVRELAAAEPDLIVVVGGGMATTTHPGSAAGSLRDLGIPFTTGAGEPVLPLSLTVGSWLVRHCLDHSAEPPPLVADRADGRPPAPPSLVADRAGRRPPDLALAVSGPRQPAPPGRIELQEVAQSWPAAECVALGERLAAAAPRVALLAMGDGAARKALGVPGAPDPPAEQYDAQVAGALAVADARVLAALDARLAAEYLVAGRAAWQVLAGAAIGNRFRGRLSYAAAPLGVSYFAASWLPY